MSNNNLHAAKNAKNDEFYTQLTDIENELAHYEAHFRSKIIYSNCDREDSNFVKYFEDNGDRLGIKAFNYTSGDFRSPESIKILKEADIVVTNPPFSLFREYIAQLMKHNKKFLIIGNQNAITFKEIFPLIRDNKLWLGLTMDGRNKWFRIPNHYIKYDKIENGNKYAFVKAVVWYTNLTHKKRYEDIILYKTYNENDYPTYDNYDAIEVSKVKEIPKDYDDVMGVPISFLHKYNPDQFEILGITKNWDSFYSPYKDYKKIERIKKDGSIKTVNTGKALLLEINSKPNKEYFLINNVKMLIEPYPRLIIKVK